MGIGIEFEKWFYFMLISKIDIKINQGISVQVIIKIKINTIRLGRYIKSVCK